MPQIFISYRREDSQAYAGRICEALADKFGSRRVFMDIDSIAPGTRFPDVLNQALRAADVVLVIIGRHWLEIKDEHGNRRLQNEKDYVRLEIAAALARKAPIIPLLVQGASVPNASELPPDLSALVELEALELSDTRWSYDLGRLKAAIRELGPSRTAVALRRAVAFVRAHRRLAWLGPLGTCLAAVALWEASNLFSRSHDADNAEKPVSGVVGRDRSNATERAQETNASRVVSEEAQTHDSSGTNQVDRILFTQSAAIAKTNVDAIRQVKLLRETGRALQLEVTVNYTGASGVGNVEVLVAVWRKDESVQASGSKVIGVGETVQRIVAKSFTPTAFESTEMSVGIYQRTSPNNLELIQGPEKFPLVKHWSEDSP